MSYHWTDVMVLWAALEQDYDAMDATLQIYKPEALQELALTCDLIRNKATNIYFKKTEGGYNDNLTTSQEFS